MLNRYCVTMFIVAISISLIAVDKQHTVSHIPQRELAATSEVRKARGLPNFSLIIRMMMRHYVVHQGESVIELSDR